MLQKTIWMRYFTLGISMIFITLFTQCKKHQDYLVKGTYVYVNRTNYLIEIKRGVDLFTLNPNESHTIEQIGEGPKDVTEKDYIPRFQGGEIIVYDNEMCDTLLISKEGFTGIENYLSQKLGDRNYKFKYTFTQTDYQKAQPCE